MWAIPISGGKYTFRLDWVQAINTNGSGYSIQQSGDGVSWSTCPGTPNPAFSMTNTTMITSKLGIAPGTSPWYFRIKTNASGINSNCCWSPKIGPYYTVA
jgi:hypothetical protein